MLANLLILVTGVFADDLIPSQIKLSWTGVPGELVMNWATYAAAKPEIHYSVANEGKFKVVYAKQTIFSEGLLRKMMVNEGTVTGLEHGESYTYYVGSYGKFSDHYTFTYFSPNSTGSPRLAIFGDWGIGHRGRYTLDLLESHTEHGDLDGMFICGDMAYNLQDLDGDIGDKFLDEIQPVTSVVPTMVIPGNHEAYHNFSQVIGRFSMPKGAYNYNTGLFYSINLGAAHILMFTDELYFRSGEDHFIDVQMSFLEADLAEANANRAERPWIIAISHHPLYCSGYIVDHCITDADKMRSKLEDLLYNHKVDLVFDGHLHAYQRNTAIYKDKEAGADEETSTYIKNAKAPVYIVAGAAGNIEGPLPLPNGGKPWSRVLSNKIGYGVLDVLNSTTLYWKQYDAETGGAYDHYYYIKSPIS